MDGVDAVLTDITQSSINAIDMVSVDYPPALLNSLHQLCEAGSNEINITGSADRQVAKLCATAVATLLQKNNLHPKDIVAIGSHGQTVRHHPHPLAIQEGSLGFTLQIGDPNTLAAETNIDVVADFRRKDIALGGQGAPLAPAFHHAIFGCENESRALINIGGLANVTYLPALQDTSVMGFDTGPGNTLMDAWCRQHIGRSFDQDGLWARSGNVSNDLLTSLLSEPYFSQPAPKSTGRELFHLPWLSQHLSQFPRLSPQDVQATLLTLTVESIALSLANLGAIDSCYICGGGAANTFLMEQLQKRLAPCKVLTTNALGLHYQWVEGAAFAWLSYAYMNDLPGNLPAVTGASRACVLGGLYKAK